MFKLKMDGNEIKCFYNNNLQGNIKVINDNVSLGIKEYVKSGTGALTLRSAVPETEFSEYNIAKVLIDEAKNKNLIPEKYFSTVSPEMFGYQSYEAVLIEENYANMSKEELLQIIVDTRLQFKALEQQGFI